MEYKGRINSQCPLCSAHLTAHRIPVMVRVGRINRDGIFICGKCFEPYQKKSTQFNHERDIPEFEKELDEMARKLFKIPVDHEIRGFWMTLFDHGPLGVVVNYESE
jgi:hypothetical protein